MPPQSSASVAAVIATVTAGALAGGGTFAAGGCAPVGSGDGGSTVSCGEPAFVQARSPTSTHA